MRWIATFFLAGYSPVAPGTAGTLGGLLIYLGMVYLKIGCLSQGLIIAGLFFIGVISAGKMENLLKIKDPPCVVIDEVVGFLITMWGLPLSLRVVVIGFILNRVLDIWKPFPAKESQRLPGGWGIMVDDVISSFYANIILRGLLLLGL